MLNKAHQHIARAFNRAANTYDLVSSAQFLAGLHLISLIDKTIHYENILDLGCGSGKITQQLIENISFNNFMALDISHESLAIAKERLPKYTKVVEENFDEFNAAQKQFSLIFANMALHWSTDFEKLLKKIKTWLAPHGLFAFSVPLSGTFFELDNGNPFLTSAEMIQILRDFKLIHRDEKTYTQTFENTHDALSSLKLAGVTYQKKRTHIGLTRNLNITLKQLSLTYHIGSFVVSN